MADVSWDRASPVTWPKCVLRVLRELAGLVAFGWVILLPGLFLAGSGVACLFWTLRWLVVAHQEVSGLGGLYLLGTALTTIYVLMEATPRLVRGLRETEIPDFREEWLLLSLEGPFVLGLLAMGTAVVVAVSGLLWPWTLIVHRRRSRRAVREAIDREVAELRGMIAEPRIHGARTPNRW